MKIYNSIVSWIIKKRIHHINNFVKSPHKVQEELRQKLIDQSYTTEFGKKYNFKNIHSRSDFTQYVPLSVYEDLEPYINRMRSGQQNILWPTDIKWFAKSSGTVNYRSKFIPVSNESIKHCHFKGGKDLLSLYCNNFNVNKIFVGKSVMLGGSYNISALSGSIYEGDLSAIIVENLPFWVQLQQSPHKEIALMSEWEEKIDLMVDQSIRQNVTSLSGVPSWVLVF